MESFDTKTSSKGHVTVIAKKRSIKALKGLVIRPEAVVDVDAVMSTEVTRRNIAASA